MLGTRDEDRFTVPLRQAAVFNGSNLSFQQLGPDSVKFANKSLSRLFWRIQSVNISPKISVLNVKQVLVGRETEQMSNKTKPQCI